MPTTIKAALKKWEEATGRKAGEAKEIKLIGVYPPIEKMEVSQLTPTHNSWDTWETLHLPITFPHFGLQVHPPNIPKERGLVVIVKYDK